MTPNPSRVARVAVVQAAPALFDRERTLAKVATLTAEAAADGAQLVLFPEAFIPAYPRGLSFGCVVGARRPEGRRTWQVLWENAVEVPGPAIDALAATAVRHHVHLAIGVVERDATYSRGTLYCTLLLFGPDGTLLAKHRKLKPTGSERLIWGEGDGSDLTVTPTPLGRLGGLICWENYMPLARTALYAQGVELYLAPTADARETWLATLRHIACKGRCFVLGCNQYVTKSMVPQELPGVEELADQPEALCRGGSAVISPLGDVIAGPLYDEEGMLIADLDLDEIVRAKFDFDAVGHYARPDVLQLLHRATPRPPVVAPSVPGEEA